MRTLGAPVFPAGTIHVTLVVLASTAFFLALHFALWRLLERDFNRSFRMGRGFAAVMLTVLGLVAMVDAFDSLRIGFLYRHPPGGWMIGGVAIAYGHLLADCISMAYGKLALDFQPRNDLIVHHALALLCYGIALGIGVGHALVLVSLASEAMPCCSGLEAWGKHLSSERMIRAGNKGRRLILLFWRLPLWALVMSMLARTAIAGEVPDDMVALWIFTMSAFVPVIALDIYWVRKCAAREMVSG